MSILKVKDLKKDSILKGVSFEIKEGEMIATANKVSDRRSG